MFIFSDIFLDSERSEEAIDFTKMFPFFRVGHIFFRVMTHEDQNR